MKKTALCFAVAVAVAAPAYAQLGNLGKIKQRADQAKKLTDTISEKEERAIGESASRRLIDAFGIYQDAAVAKYVTLVGTVLAEVSERPKLDWKFIVLDSDGVNAYAAPGGIVHITRGALAFIKSEAELAGVLGHEITHITEKHTVKAIQKSKRMDVLTDEAGAQKGGLTGAVINQLGDIGFEILFENKFDRNDELEADSVGLQLASKVGYSPNGLNDFLNRLVERNKGRKEPNGLFASHPQLKERIEKNGKTVKDGKLTSTAMVEARYASSVKVDAKPMSAITVIAPGTRGVTADAGATTAAKPEEKKEDAPAKKKGFGLGGLGASLTQGKQAESTQASASAGGRMATPDTDASGGTNRNPVRVTLTPAEIAEFKKGIA